MKRALPAIVLTVILAGCGSAHGDRAGGHAGGATRTLTLAWWGRDTSDLNLFRDAVSRLSGGALRIDVKRGWRGGDTAYETHTIEDVAAGKADLSAAASRAWDTVGIPELRALGAPLLIDSYPLQRRV